MTGIESAQPNFLRVMRRVRPSVAGNQPFWNHRNDGNPGIPRANVAADAAWTISRGHDGIRVAVLGEGVDTRHPALKAAVVAQWDAGDGNTHARPDGDDAHGTPCTGIILSRDTTYPGLAPGAALVAVRIAKGDGGDGWIFEVRARKKVTAGLRALMQGWILANTSTLTATSRAALEADGSLQRVFESTGAQLVALPEVRVEETRATHKRKLKNWLAKIAEAEIQSIDDDEITILRPRSGRGDDAIRLAGRIFKEAHPEAATPRFIRIVARPRTELHTRVPHQR